MDRTQAHADADLKNGRARLLRQIPSVDELMSIPGVRKLEQDAGRRLVLESAREVVQSLRCRIGSGEATEISVHALGDEIAKAVERKRQFSLRRVINASGVILHTNLGRAPLAREVFDHVAEIGSGYSNLEYDLDAGERGQRDRHTATLFARLLGAEATLVVNNNAAAVFLALNTLADGGEVVVSRGELIEIGGSFRIPDICSKSGAILREVGTTNRTRVADYAAAINERTRVLLRVHPSNFRVIGFTQRPALDELVELARKRNLLLVEDLGSGCLIDLVPLGVKGEPTTASSLHTGVDVITFSGDKLLGGPQAGILTGKREPLARIRKNPLFRALRVDKMTIAALEATVGLYLRDDPTAIPALRMIGMTAEQVGARAARLAGRIKPGGDLSIRLLDGESVMGGGSTPGQSLPTRLLAITHIKHTAQALETRLRTNRPPIVSRVDHDTVLLDLRTVFEDQEDEIVRALERL